MCSGTLCNSEKEQRTTEHKNTATSHKLTLRERSQAQRSTKVSGGADHVLSLDHSTGYTDEITLCEIPSSRTRTIHDLFCKYIIPQPKIYRKGSKPAPPGSSGLSDFPLYAELVEF